MMMFTLPPSRKEFRCRNKRQQGSGNCDQAIYKSDKDGHVKNVTDGRGGPRDTDHICPDRVGSPFHKVTPINMREYDYHQENKPCVSCGHKYNAYMNPLCPNCFRLRCRFCQNLQQWIVLLDDNGEWHPTKCFSCGHPHLDVEAIPKDLINK